MKKNWEMFLEEVKEIKNLEAIGSLLYWDQSTYMPSGGNSARGKQLALVQKIGHEKLVSNRFKELLEEVEKENYSADSFENALIKNVRKNFDEAVKVPAELLNEITIHGSNSYMNWVEARKNNDFSLVKEDLEKTIELSRRYANCFAPFDHIADPLIDFSDAGMRVDFLKELFSELRKELVPIVKKISEQPKIDDSCVLQNFDEAKQLEFAEHVAKQIGYDFERGRQDKTHHPFMINFSIGDVRITTRTKANDFREALWSTIHEAGHAMYEQGINPDFEATHLAGGVSSGVHESQSRLWENIVGRSLEFWEYFYPQLQEKFPQQFKNVELKTFYKAINKVEPSLIRTDADEVTYNLHVMIRFQIECDLLDGTLKVKDLPKRWNELYKEYLGIEPDSDSNGILQDMHWYSGMVGGMFQGYAIGNLLNAAFFDKALKVNPEIKNNLKEGNFSPLLKFLQDEIYQFGSFYPAPELIKNVLGEDMSVKPFINYLKEKYSAIYNIEM